MRLRLGLLTVILVASALAGCARGWHWCANEHPWGTDCAYGPVGMAGTAYFNGWNLTLAHEGLRALGGVAREDALGGDVEFPGQGVSVQVLKMRDDRTRLHASFEMLPEGPRGVGYTAEEAEQAARDARPDAEPRFTAMVAVFAHATGWTVVEGPSLRPMTVVSD